MSKPDTTSIKCPTCGHVSSITFWSSVNATLSPTLRQQIMSDDMRNHVCLGCGQNLVINTDLLYHDMNLKFMIFYRVTEGGRIPSMSADFLEKFGASLPNHQLRFVTSWNQLKEKIRIFEAGLDDNIVEFVKMFVGS